MREGNLFWTSVETVRSSSECYSKEFNVTLEPTLSAAKVGDGGRSYSVERGLTVWPHPWGMHRQYFVYILASDTHELYVGVTNNLARRLWEHRSGQDPHSYSHRHATGHLVYFEMTANVRSAVQREKQLKRLPRQMKLQLIEGTNPEWRDLAANLL